MQATILPHKPLIEALVELKWVPLDVRPLANTDIGLWTDPGYPLYLGILFEKLRERFPVVEDLPTKQLPDELTSGTVKTRFRTGPEAWPLVQAGPGILAVNFTDSYTWSEFRATTSDAFQHFSSAYASTGTPVPALTSATLRFIDGILTKDHDLETMTFLRQLLHTDLRIADGVSHAPQVAGPVKSIDLRLAWPLSNPQGTGHLRIATGTSRGDPAIICDFSVNSQGEDAPKGHEAVLEWLENAHTLIESWFFTLVDGELLRQFQGAD